MKKKIILILALYFAGLFFRLYQLDQTSVYPDEITWMVYGKESFYALKNLNIEYFKNAWWNDPTDAHAIGWPLVVFNGLSHVFLAGTGQYSLHLLPDIIASRLPLVIFGPLTAVALFLFASRYLSLSSALVIALAYTINPIAIALDRWVLHDSPLTLFSFLSITTYLSAARTRRLSLLPGIFLSLAFLTKPQGILPAIAWITYLVFNRRTIRLFLVNLGSFIAATLLIWPQSWFDPFLSIPKYLYSRFVLSSSGDPIPNFYFGPTRNPHWSYYFFQLLFRTPILVIILGLGGLFYRVRAKSSTIAKAPLAAVVAYVTIFMVAHSVVANKGGVRYILPLFPWIYLAAGFGLEKLKVRLFSYILILLLLIPVLTYHPDYYLYYNQLIGGPKGAQKYDMIGPCLGSKQALEYLDAQSIPGMIAILGCSDTGPYHSSRPQTKDWARADILILELSYKQQYPNRPEVVSAQKRELIYTVYQESVATAWVYRQVFAQSPTSPDRPVD